MIATRSGRGSRSLALRALPVGFALAALAGCGDDGTSGAGGGSSGSAGEGGGGAEVDAALVEETCLEHLAVLTTFGDDAGCTPSLDAEECASLSVEPCAAELQVAHACLTAELTAPACTCADDDAGDPVLECDFDGLCEAERSAYTSCL